MMNLERIEWKLAACSVVLIAVSLAVFDISIRLEKGATDPDAIGMLGFALLILIGGAGISLAIASVSVALFATVIAEF